MKECFHSSADLEYINLVLVPTDPFTHVAKVQWVSLIYQELLFQVLESHIEQETTKSISLLPSLFPPSLLPSLPIFLFIVVLFYDRVSLCSPGYPQTGHSPASASQLLGLYSSSPNWFILFFLKKIVLFLCLRVLHACMSVQHMTAMPGEVRRGQQMA